MKMKNKSKKNAPKAKQQGTMVSYQAPLAKTTTINGARTPKMTYASDGSCRITHGEYIRDVYSRTSGVAEPLLVNPQSSAAFTWLSAIATRFEMYRFKQLKFTFKTSSSTTQDGFVILGFDFDAYDEAPTKASMLQWKYSAKTSCWNNQSLDVSADTRIATWRYCNYLNLGSQGDSRLDYLGNFFLLCNTAVDNVYVGELFVDYTIEFRQPSYKLPPIYSESIISPTWVTSNAFFTQPVAFQGNVPIVVNTANKIIIPVAGEFLVTTKINGSGITSPPLITVSTPTDYLNQESTLTDFGTSFTATQGTSIYRLSIPVGGALLTFTASGTTIVQSFVRIATYFLGS